MKINALDKQTFTGETVEPVEELTADEANQFLHELQNIISSSGQALSAAKLTQVSESMARYASGGRSYKDESTTAGYYQLSGQNNFKMPSAYQLGMVAEFVAGSTNVDIATVNISGLGTKDIFDEIGNPLVGGEIVDGHQITLFYSGTDFVLPNWSNALKLGGGAGSGGVADGVGVATVNNNDPDQNGNVEIIEFGQVTDNQAVQVVPDWNHISNLVHGINQHKMYGSWQNGFGRSFYYHLLNLKVKGEEGHTQIAFPITNGYDNVAMIRIFYGGVWRPWSVLGKGCDAGRLEGHNWNDILALLPQIAISDELVIGYGTVAQFATNLPAGGFLKTKIILICKTAVDGFAVGDVVSYYPHESRFNVFEVAGSAVRTVKFVSAVYFGTNDAHKIFTPTGGAHDLHLHYSKWRVRLVVERVT